MKPIIHFVIAAFIIVFSVDALGNGPKRSAGRPVRLAKPSGGLVFSQIEGKAIYILNLQDLATDSAINEAVNNIMLHIRVPLKISNGNRKSSVEDSISSIFRNDDIAALAVLTSTNGKDSMLYYPDRNLCIINVKSLLEDDPDKITINNRVFKQIWRAVGLILGAGEAVGGFSILQKVNSLEQLDSIKAKLPSPEQHNRMVETISTLGMSMLKAGTYRTACQQGWAPAPTNDVQKAIWKEIHAMPTAPIKIKPETKKVRE